jgi:hypothetical protein
LKREDAAITPEVNFNEPGTSDLFIEKVCVAEYVIQTNWISDQVLLSTEFNLNAADHLSTGHIQIVQEMLARKYKQVNGFFNPNKFFQAIKIYFY